MTRSSSVLLALVASLVLCSVDAKAFPTDIDGNFTYKEGNKPELCPKNIEHTTFNSAGQPGVWALSHNTIKHDGRRCNSKANERQFIFYRGELVQKSDSIVPVELIDLLKSVGQNIDIDFPLNRSLTNSGENYYIGYESVGRFCQNNSKFENGTVAFLFRPFLPINMPVKGIKLFQFLQGNKYMIMVPRYENAICVYEAPVVGDRAVNATTTPQSVANTTSPVTPATSDTVTIETDTSPEASISPKPNAVCFPATAIVELSDGSFKKMSDLHIGDNVRTSAASFSTIFMFTHRIPSGKFHFLHITTTSGSSIELSAGHYLYVNGRLATAASVRVGDLLDASNGETEIVSSIVGTVNEGLYNPQTEDGDIVVGGLRASAYTTAVAPKAAHALLTPLRLAYSFLGLATTAVEGGADNIAKMAPRGEMIY